MNVPEILSRLQSMTNDKVLAHNKKYGAGDNQYGVKLGDIRALAKKLKTNHALGLELWQTGILDAQLLACLILQPKSLSVAELDALVRSMDFVHVADWFSSYVLKEHPDKDQLIGLWIHADNKWAARCGWALMAGKVARDSDGLDLDQLLTRLEQEMPNALPEVQWTMNTTLAYIGIYHPQQRARALEIGERLGILRDYPVSKGCTSPFAPIWINEMVRRQEGAPAV